MVTMKKGMPITGSKTAMKPKPQVQTEVGRNAEQQIKLPPAPFKNKRGPANAPYDRQPDSRGTDITAPGKVAKGDTVGAKALPPGGPVGYSKMPNQSKQIAGRFGTDHGGRKAGNPKVQPSAKKHKAFYNL